MSVLLPRVEFLFTRALVAVQCVACSSFTVKIMTSLPRFRMPVDSPTAGSWRGPAAILGTSRDRDRDRGRDRSDRDRDRADRARAATVQGSDAPVTKRRTKDRGHPSLGELCSAVGSGFMRVLCRTATTPHTQCGRLIMVACTIPGGSADIIPCASQPPTAVQHQDGFCVPFKELDDTPALKRAAR
jgi:hypothetical protein